MSTSIQEQDLIQTIKQLEQRISDLERQQRTIGSDGGSVVTNPNSTIYLSDFAFTPNGKAMELTKDGIIFYLNDPTGFFTSDFKIEAFYNPTGSSILYIDGAIDVGTADIITLILSGFTPSSSSFNGQAGQFTWDSNYLYICVATNSWKRITLSSF
jgi:hypothetical protein